MTFDGVRRKLKGK